MGIAKTTNAPAPMNRKYAKELLREKDIWPGGIKVSTIRITVATIPHPALWVTTGAY